MTDNNHIHDENCNHEHEEMDLITLTLDDDTEIDCVVLGNFEVEDKEYIALLPLDENGEQVEDVLIYEYKEVNEEEFELVLIESEEEFELVSRAFEELFVEDDEDDEDDEEDEEEDEEE